MRYRELGIETRREAPARARSLGASLLGRAGYFDAAGESTALGLRALAVLRESAARVPAFFATLGVSVVDTSQQESIFPLPSGDVDMLRCSNCGYADLADAARFARPPSAEEPMRPLERVATPDCGTIEALAAFLHVPKDRTAKALMYTRPVDGRFVFVVIRGDMQLSMSQLAAVVGDVEPESTQEIERRGAVAGYASPVGLQGALIVVDESIPTSANLVGGANQVGYHLLNVNYGRDYAAELVADLALAQAGDGCPNCGKPLSLLAGIVLRDGHGYDFGNVLLAVAEIHHDERGLCMPRAAAPFEVYLAHLPARDLDTFGPADALYAALRDAGLTVLYDDRNERAGVKFNDADLIGCPGRVTVGERNLKNAMVELKSRSSDEANLVPLSGVIPAIQSLLDNPHD